MFYYNLTLTWNVFYATIKEGESVKQCNDFQMHRHAWLKKKENQWTLFFLLFSKEDFYEVLIASRKNNKEHVLLKLEEQDVSIFALNKIIFPKYTHVTKSLFLFVSE